MKRWRGRRHRASKPSVVMSPSRSLYPFSSGKLPKLCSEILWRLPCISITANRLGRQPRDLSVQILLGLSAQHSFHQV